MGGGRIDEATLRSTFKIGDIPTRAPAFMDLNVDRNGNLWAGQLTGSDSTRTTWDIFDPRGVWLGTVSAPVPIARFAPAVFGTDALYTSVEDDLGRPVIVRFRLVR